jgi:hypothetical protein
MMDLAKKLVPPLNEVDAVLKDPIALHNQVLEAVHKLVEVLEIDYQHGYGESFNAGLTTERSDNAKGEQSISGGNDGNGQIHVGGSFDERVQAGLQYIKTYSANSNSGHKAEVESREGD